MSLFHFGFLLSLSIHFPLSLSFMNFSLCGFTLFHFFLLFHSHFSICSGQLGQKQEDYIFTLPTKATHCLNTIYPLCPSNHHQSLLHKQTKTKKQTIINVKNSNKLLPGMLSSSIPKIGVIGLIRPWKHYFADLI